MLPKEKQVFSQDSKLKRVRSSPELSVQEFLRHFSGVEVACLPSPRWLDRYRQQKVGVEVAEFDHRADWALVDQSLYACQIPEPDSQHDFEPDGCQQRPQHIGNMEPKHPCLKPRSDPSMRPSRHHHRDDHTHSEVACQQILMVVMC